MGEESLKTKQKILEGTYRYLLEQGSQNLSARSIAKAIGVNHGLIHHYFGSKENLLLAFIDYFNQKVLEKAQRPPTQNPQDGVKFLLKEVVLNEEVAPIITEILSLARDYPSIQVKLQIIMKHRVEMLQRITQRTDKRDAILLMALAQGLIALRRVHADLEIEQAISRLLEWLEQTQ